MWSGRSNRLPIAQPVEDGFVSGERKPLLRDAVSELDPGDRMLVDAAHLDALAQVTMNPDSKLLVQLDPAAATTRCRSSRCHRSDRRFRLRRVHSDR